MRDYVPRTSITVASMTCFYAGGFLSYAGGLVSYAAFRVSLLYAGRFHSYADEFLSYVAHVSPTLQISFYARISLLPWRISILRCIFLSYPLHISFYAIAKFLFCARISLLRWRISLLYVVQICLLHYDLSCEPAKFLAHIISLSI